MIAIVAFYEDLFDQLLQNIEFKKTFKLGQQRASIENRHGNQDHATSAKEGAESALLHSCLSQT